MKSKVSNRVSCILIAIDGSLFSNHLIEYGVYMAKKLTSEVVVVHVNEVPLEAPFMMNPLATELSTQMIDVIQIEEQANKELLAHFTKKWGKEIPIRTYTKVGKAKEEIIATAQECKADLIIMGTHGRHGLEHFIFGSVAESVIREAICPVLILPDKAKEE